MTSTDNLDFGSLRKVLDRITSRLVESSDPGALFEAVVEIAMDTTEAQACSLYLEQPQGESGEASTIVMVAGAGYELRRVGKAIYRKGQGLTGYIWDQSKSVKYDTAQDLEKAKGPWRGVYNDIIRAEVPDWVCSSLVGVPLRIGERTFGVIKVENKNPGPEAHFSERDLRVLELIASTMALAIENRRLSEETYSNILTALREVSEMLVSKEIMPFSALCDRIVRKCIEIFNAQACSLYLETPGSDPSDPAQAITMVAGAGYEVYRIGKAVYRKGEGLTGSIWQDSRCVKYDTAQDLEKAKGPWRGVYNDIIRAEVPDWVCSSLVGVPLRIGTRTIGVIKVENKNPAPVAHFSHEELRSLEILAGNIALALEMLSRQREIFWQGERARAFAHNITNQIRNASSFVDQTKVELDRAPTPNQIGHIQEGLARLQETLTKFEELRQQTLAETRVGRHHVPVDVRMLLTDLSKRSDKILAERHITLDAPPPQEPLFVNVDRDQILRALENILANAIEALANHTDPRIAIKVGYLSKRNEVAISVIDNGPGLTNEQRENYKQARRIPSTKHPGIGMGLAEADRSCTDNFGYLEIPDGGGENPGGIVRVVLPTFNPQVLRLAIIDDDPGILGNFEWRLEGRNDIQASYHTSQYCLLPAAGRDDREGSPNMNANDFILLDCHFNVGLNGVEIFRDLRKASSPLADKVLLMSAYEGHVNTPGVQVLDKYKDILDKFDEFVASLHSRRGQP